MRPLRSADPTSRRSVVALALLLSLACDRDAPVYIRAELAAGVPLAGFEVMAVPFDAEELLDSLASSSATPRPTFPELERRLSEYRVGDRDTLQPDAQLTAAWLATRDSVMRLSEQLRRMDRTTAAYKEAYARFRDLYARYSAREATREAALRRLFSADRALADQAALAADSLRRWEREAYREFPRLASERVRGQGLSVERVSTDSAGHFVLRLPPGTWWLNARFPNPDNPFVEYRWNVPLRVAGLPMGVPLSGHNTRIRWRH